MNGPGDVGGPSVVVADDVASIRELYSAVLSPVGLRVVGAAKGAAAMAQVRELDVAVLVLDVNLPDMTGKQVMDRLRAEPATQDVSVLIVTGDDATERRIAGLDKGANDYLTKPVNPRELLARVQGQMRVRDLWLNRMDDAMSLRRRQAADLADLDAGLPPTEPANGVAKVLRIPLGVNDLVLTPVLGGGLGRPVAASGDPVAVLTQDAGRALTGPAVTRISDTTQVHVPLESRGAVFAVLSLATSAAPDRVLPAVLDLRPQLSMLVYPGLGAETELLRTRGEIDALVRDQAIVAVFQPIVELSTRRIVGFEGLSRFPDGAAPEDWFAHPVALGLGPRLEAVAIRALLADAARLPGDPFLTVNVSVDTLLSTDLAPILATLSRQLLIELTEHDLIHDYDSVRDAVERLAGVGLCVDDAGSSYASLRHVFRLRPELVVLDRDWIAGLDQDPARQSLVAGLLDFTGKLGAVLVGEGIETEAEPGDPRRPRGPARPGLSVRHRRPGRELDAQWPGSCGTAAMNARNKPMSSSRWSSVRRGSASTASTTAPSPTGAATLTTAVGAGTYPRCRDSVPGARPRWSSTSKTTSGEGAASPDTHVLTVFCARPSTPANAVWDIPRASIAAAISAPKRARRCACSARPMPPAHATGTAAPPPGTGRFRPNRPQCALPPSWQARNDTQRVHRRPQRAGRRRWWHSSVDATAVRATRRWTR